MQPGENEEEQADGGARLRALYAASGGLHAVFGDKVADYQASRPDYPPALFEQLAQGLGAAAAIGDLGAGTGLLTEGLLARGWRVWAIEPNEGMRAACDRRLGGRPGYRSAAGSAEAVPLPDASLDLLTAAQAFHWFQIEAARAEALRVLKPGGQVALIWNDRADTPLHRALNEIFARHGGARRYALLAAEDRGQLDRFFLSAPPQQWQWPHAHRLDVRGLLSLVFSRSYMPRPDSPAGQAAASELLALFERLAEADGRVEVAYTTVLFLGRP